jgi:diacylglycerol kinase family enzyme
MYLAPDAGRFGMIRQALALALRRAEERRDFHLISAHKFTVTSRRRRQKVALDGERLRLRAPLVIEAHLDALKVLVQGDLHREIR